MTNMSIVLGLSCLISFGVFKAVGVSDGSKLAGSVDWWSGRLACMLTDADIEVIHVALGQGLEISLHILIKLAFV